VTKSIFPFRLRLLKAPKFPVRPFGVTALALTWFLCASALAQEIPAGTRLEVRLDADVSSRTAHAGDIVPASLARDLIVDGEVFARAGAPLRGKVTYAQRSGRFHSPGYLTVRLSSIEVDGRRYRLHSTAIRDKGDGHTDSNLEKIGGGAGIGSIIGAIAGGGKGALIGGLLGAGAGTGVAAATGRRPAEFTAESVYGFTLTSSARPRGQWRRR
jgi:hypothetical protein